ncbi:siderophore-interacting protein [Streptomyces polygonati]|uniref:Siderophore-interacting protein n=1 Tax=Streptomyces polygonati TaxID=1617087 RepID=A0ABV8HDD3_9ACTN
MNAARATGSDAGAAVGGAKPIAGQFRFFRAHVVSSRRLGPTLVRITFGGEQLASFASGGRDQSFSLFLPRPGQAAPLIPADADEGWFQRWRSQPEEERAVMRSYTIRSQRRGSAEVDVDFALHGAGPGGPAGAAGPASRWAARAAPGDQVVLLGPAVADNRSVRFQPPAGTDWILLAADETALPAVGGILEWLPAGSRVKAWIEVPYSEDIQDLPSAADAEIVWLVRGDRDRTAGEPAGGGPLTGAVRAAELPEGAPYAWIAGESAMVRALRRHVVGERGLDRASVEFSGYWRRGASEEQLRAEAQAPDAG